MMTKTQRRSTGRWIGIVAVVVLIIGGAFAASVLAGIGPFASERGGNASTDAAGAGNQSETMASSTDVVSTGAESAVPTSSETVAERSVSQSPGEQGSTSDQGSNTDAASGFETITESTQRRAEGTTRVSGTGTETEDDESGSSSSPSQESDPPGFDTPTPSPTREPTVSTSYRPASTATAGDQTDSSSGYTNEDFRQALENEGITVLALRYDRTYPSDNESRPVVLEYTTSAATASGYRDEAGVVAQVYASAVANGYQPRSLSATAYEGRQRPVAAYRIERDWASAYAEGSISGQEYGGRVGDTYRVIEQESTGAARRR